MTTARQTAGMSPELSPGDSRVRYRLVRQPRSRLPARDHLGNYLCIPAQHDSDPPP